MAIEGVQVDIDDFAIITALNTPGGGVFEWRDETAIAIVNRAILVSPVNDPLNALHRFGVGSFRTRLVGEFKASWGFDRIGSNGHQVRATIYNGADHAVFVELGRSPSSKYQRFSWTEWGGEISSVGGYWGVRGDGTGERLGRHILRDSVNAVMPGATGGSYAPLT